MYEFLSGKKLPLLPTISAPAPPSFARNTASRVALEVASAPSAPVDDAARAALMGARLAEHRREGTESRAGSSGGAMAVGVRGATVRSLGEEAAHVRSARDLAWNGGGGRSAQPADSEEGAHGGGSRAASPLDRGSQLTAGTAASPASALMLEATLGGPGKVLEVLNAAVVDTLSPSDGGALAALDPSRPPALAFTETLIATPRALPRPDALAVLAAMARAAPSIAAGCLASPQGFFHVLTVLLQLVIALPEASDEPLAAAAAYALECVGSAMTGGIVPPSLRTAGGVGADAVTAQLFRDFALPRCIDLLQKRAEKRVAILRIALAFGGGGLVGSGARSRIDMIQALQQQLADLTTFIHCLSLLAAMDNHERLEVRLAGSGRDPLSLLTKMTENSPSPSPPHTLHRMTSRTSTSTTQ